MLRTALNIIAFAAIAAVLVASESGALPANDAFFLAAAIATLVTGAELTRRVGSTYGQAFRQMFFEPSSHGSRGAYLAYVASGALAFVIVAKTAVLGA